MKRFLDAKSTSSAFDNPIHVSLAELLQAAKGPEPYDIYRIYQVTEGAAKMRIARDVGPTLRGVLAAVAALPKGVDVDSFSIAPSFLSFGSEEITLRLPDEGEETNHWQNG